MRFYFTEANAPEADDVGVEFASIHEALHEAGRTALRIAHDTIADEGEVTLNVFNDEGLVGKTIAILRTSRAGSFETGFRL